MPRFYLSQFKIHKQAQRKKKPVQRNGSIIIYNLTNCFKILWFHSSQQRAMNNIAADAEAMPIAPPQPAAHAIWF